jgi:hypothetical protein
VQLFKNIDIFLETSKHVTLCSDKLVVLKDLIRNTDTARIAADFPLYVHRLRHGIRDLFHFLQHADLDSTSKLLLETMKC